jgi:pimeloyl-ACP methyl ester carboxylesterase
MSAETLLSPANSTNVRPNSRPRAKSLINPARLIGVALRARALVAPASAARRATDLFSTPLPGTRERALRSPTDGALQRELELAEGRVMSYHWGEDPSQPLILFSHGWSSFGLRVLPWVTPLRQAGYRVASFDHLGHGRSSGGRATLPQFGRTLIEVAGKLGPVHGMIGHSLGGAAVATALSEGVLVQRAILIAPPADPLGATARFARALHLPSSLRQDMERELERREGIALSHWQAHRMAPAIGVPALIVHDVGDREVGWDEGERYARYWPHARLLSTHGLGHHHVVSAPQIILGGLRFLAGEAVGERVVSTQELPFGVA